ncbi:MAG: DUF6291 domain-containing protein [Eubacteriales bacterium]|nr:DUF6291 domain-containing protein [Eubacteriales bacterium]
MKRDSFIFYGSFREAARALDDATRLALYDAIADYGLYDEMPEAASPLVQALFTLIRPQLEANARRREAGRMGGAPPGRAVTRRPLLPAHPGRRSFLRFPRLHWQRNLWIRFFPAAQNQWFRILSKSRNLM